MKSESLHWLEVEDDRQRFRDSGRFVPGADKHWLFQAQPHSPILAILIEHGPRITFVNFSDGPLTLVVRWKPENVERIEVLPGSGLAIMEAASDADDCPGDFCCVPRRRDGGAAHALDFRVYALDVDRDHH